MAKPACGFQGDEAPDCLDTGLSQIHGCTHFFTLRRLPNSDVRKVIDGMGGKLILHHWLEEGGVGTDGETKIVWPSKEVLEELKKLK